jgi:hypothetical protein
MIILLVLISLLLLVIAAGVCFLVFAICCLTENSEDPA